MTTPCVIFDMDGTLSDVRHRLHHVRAIPPRWKEFFDGCGDDPPHEYVVQLNSMIAMAARFMHDTDQVPPAVFVCSGRPDSHRPQTEAWLREHGIFYFALLMRNDGDYRADTVVKKEMLDGIRGQGFDPIFAVDDRPSVVAMWRENDVPCFAVDDSDWRARQGHMTGDLEGRTLLTLMVGPSHGGKSTILETWGNNNIVAGTDWHLDRSHVISSDQIRRDLHGGEYVYDPAMNDRIFVIAHDLARARMEKGLPAVIDATHLRRKSRIAASELAPAGTRVRYVVVDRPLEVKLNSRRPEIPEGVIRKHHDDFRSQLRDILAGDHRPEVDVLDLRDG